MSVDAVATAQAEYRPKGRLDLSTALNPYAGPWDARLAAHLFRRAGFGGSPSEIKDAVKRGTHAAVDKLINFAPDSLPGEPQADISFSFVGADKKQRRQAVLATELWWLNRMLATPNPLQEKMVYFWSNHFTSALGEKGITPAMMVEQNNLFRSHALGNFAELTHDVSRNPAMMRYLDTVTDRKQHPNENYARELMELFTMGVGNYSEQDIRESARAFTGYTIDRREGGFFFAQRQHDDGNKTFLGRTGDFNGDDIVDIIMQQPSTARYLARKVLRAFVYDDPEAELVDALADRFRTVRYDVKQLMSTVLRSNVFYSARAYRALIKTPIEVAIGALKMLQASEVKPATLVAIVRMGQTPMRPPNVAGWPGGALWINSSTLLARVNFLNQLVLSKQAEGAGASIAPDSMASLMGSIGTDGYRKLAPGPVVDRVLDLAVQSDATPQQRDTIVRYLTTDGVGNTVTLSVENFDEKVRGAMSLALSLPAYQLA